MNNISRIIVIALFFSVTHAEKGSSKPSAETLDIVRTGFYVAVNNEDTTVNLMHFIQEEFSKDQSEYPPVILAYYAALEGLRGRHASNPITKFVHVSQAIEKMNRAVEMAPGLLEGRFLRFAFFHQIPGIFGVGNKVESDLQVTMDLLEKRDYGFAGKKLQKDMVDYLLHTDRLKNDQRARLETLAQELNTTP